MATLAASDPTRDDKRVAQELLDSLPDENSSVSGGWLFEYRPEYSRGEHPVKSRRWSYRNAHRINIPADQQKVEDCTGSEDTELAVKQQDDVKMEFE